MFLILSLGTLDRSDRFVTPLSRGWPCLTTRPPARQGCHKAASCTIIVRKSYNSRTTLVQLCTTMHIVTFPTSHRSVQVYHVTRTADLYMHGGRRDFPPSRTLGALPPVPVVHGVQCARTHAAIACSRRLTHRQCGLGWGRGMSYKLPLSLSQQTPPSWPPRKPRAERDDAPASSA